MKIKDIAFILVIALAVMVLPFNALAASGSLTITSPNPSQTYEATGGFTVSGTYIMTEDNTPTGRVPAGVCPNYGNYVPYSWDSGNRAFVRYYVDGVYKGQLGRIYEKVGWAPPPHRNLNITENFSASVNITGMNPNIPHTVEIKFVNITGIQCCSSLCDNLWGGYDDGVFASATLNFRICGAGGCNVCTNGETKACPYTGPSGTENKGICKAGTQTCSNGQWGACGGEILPAEEICGDGVDNNCDCNTDEGCAKILESVSGSGQEDYICKTLKEPFVVSVSGAAQSDVGINWMVTNSPSGANASITQSVTTSEGTETLSSAYLKLGSLPGSYSAEARCPECTQGSPQVFSASAKCPPVPAYYQGDYKNLYDNWCYVNNNKKNRATCQRDDKGNLKTGYTQFSISDIGCTLTSASMVMKWYEYELNGAPINPVTLNELMNNTTNGYKGGGFNFEAVKDVTNPDLLVYKRDIKKGEITIPKSEIDGYLEKCIPVIVMVSNKTSGHYHFVVVTKKIGDDYTINDPGYKVKPRTSLSDPAYGGDIYAFRVLYN